MPQKRNPYALAAIRTQAGQAAGDVAAALTVTHTGSARTDHFHLLNGLVPRALDEAGAIARLAAAVLAGMRVDAERMARVAREGFTNAADVADVLAATGGLDYRTAHKVVGLAVRRLIEQGRRRAHRGGRQRRRAGAHGRGRHGRSRAARPGGLRTGAAPGGLVVTRGDGRHARRGGRAVRARARPGHAACWMPPRSPRIACSSALPPSWRAETAVRATRALPCGYG